jgi:hypothetical protein
VSNFRFVIKSANRFADSRRRGLSAGISLCRFANFRPTINAATSDTSDCDHAFTLPVVNIPAGTGSLAALADSAALAGKNSEAA